MSAFSSPIMTDFSSPMLRKWIDTFFPSSNPEVIRLILVMTYLEACKLKAEWYTKSSSHNKDYNVVQRREIFVNCYKICCNYFSCTFYTNGGNNGKFDDFAEIIASSIVEIFESNVSVGVGVGVSVDYINIWTTIYHIIFCSGFICSNRNRVDIKDIITHAKVAIAKFCTGVCTRNGISVDIAHKAIVLIDKFIDTITPDSVSELCDFDPSPRNEIIFDAMMKAMKNPYPVHANKAETETETDVKVFEAGNYDEVLKSETDDEILDEILKVRIYVEDLLSGILDVVIVGVNSLFTKYYFNEYFDKHAPDTIECICDYVLNIIPTAGSIDIAHMVQAALYVARDHHFCTIQNFARGAAYYSYPNAYVLGVIV